MSEQTKESPRGTNSSFWPREKLPELHLVCLQARFFGFTRQPEGFIWCVQQGMNWSLAWILLVTPHHTVIGAALKQTVREMRRKKLLWSCDRRWTEVSLWVDVNVLPDLTPAHAASCSMTFDLSPQLWVAAVWYSQTDDVTDEVLLIESHVMSWWHTHTISLKEIQTQCSSVCETAFHHSSQFCHFSCVQLRATEDRLLESVCHWQHLDASSLKQRHTKHTASCDRAEGSHWDTASRALWWLRGIIQKHSATLSSLDVIKSLINIIFFEG